MREPDGSAQRPAALIVVMGVAGSGKSTIGPLLAEALECAFLEGDSLHPAANIAKMRMGIPLTDADRAPWLEAIREHLVAAYERDDCLVVACSALKVAYRDFLAEGLPLAWVFLAGTNALIRERLEQRTGHFLPVELLDSQAATLEVPEDAIVADVSKPPREVVEDILAALRAT